MFLWGMYLGIDLLLHFMCDVQMCQVLLKGSPTCVCKYTLSPALCGCSQGSIFLPSLVWPGFSIFASLMDVISDLITNEGYIFSHVRSLFRMPLLQSTTQDFCSFSYEVVLFLCRKFLYIWTLMITSSSLWCVLMKRWSLLIQWIWFIFQIMTCFLCLI